MPTADGGCGQSCQSLVLEDFRPCSPWGAHMWGQAPADPYLLQRKTCIYVFLFTTNIFLSPWQQHISVTVHWETVTPAEEQEFFISEEHAMLWLGTEYNTMEVGKTAIGRLLPLQNVTCTPNPTAKLRKLLWIFNILGWSWLQLCIS